MNIDIISIKALVFMGRVKKFTEGKNSGIRPIAELLIHHLFQYFNGVPHQFGANGSE